MYVAPYMVANDHLTALRINGYISTQVEQQALEFNHPKSEARRAAAENGKALPVETDARSLTVWACAQTSLESHVRVDAMLDQLKLQENTAKQASTLLDARKASLDEGVLAKAKADLEMHSWARQWKLYRATAGQTPEQLADSALRLVPYAEAGAHVKAMKNEEKYDAMVEFTAFKALVKHSATVISEGLADGTPIDSSNAKALLKDALSATDLSPYLIPNLLRARDML